MPLLLLLVALIFSCNALGVSLENGPSLNFQRGALLVIYVYPPILNLTAGSTGTVRLIVTNYGESPAYNSTLTILGPDYVNFTSDGIRWAHNLTINLGVLSGGKNVPVTLFVRLRESKNATITLTLIADNADPSIAVIQIRGTQKQGSLAVMEGLTYAGIAFAFAGGVAYLLLTGKIFRRKQIKTIRKKRYKSFI